MSSSKTDQEYQIKVTFEFASQEHMGSGNNGLVYQWTDDYVTLLEFERDVLIPVINELNVKANNFGFSKLPETMGKR